MPSWNDLLNELGTKQNPAEAASWLQDQQDRALQRISQCRSDHNVIFYASAFLQKPHLQGQHLQITLEEINGFMSVLYGMDWKKGLTLVLHTPGGITNAAETIVAYLWSKFPDIEVIIPTYAMSAGTMISLAANRIIMGRQSQLGPIDPQLPVGGRYVSARAIVDQFDRARNDVLGDRNLAHVWAPVLQTLGPALLQEAQYALGYGERMVAQWLEAHMLSAAAHPHQSAAATAKFFNDASEHRSHGRRIDRDEARLHEVEVIDLEADQALQEAVLTAYHAVTILFEKTPASKILYSHQGRRWMKNAVTQLPTVPIPPNQ